MFDVFVRLLMWDALLSRGISKAKSNGKLWTRWYCSMAGARSFIAPCVAVDLVSPSRYTIASPKPRRPKVHRKQASFTSYQSAGNQQ